MAGLVSELVPLLEEAVEVVAVEDVVAVEGAAVEGAAVSAAKKLRRFAAEAFRNFTMGVAEATIEGASEAEVGALETVTMGIFQQGNEKKEENPNHEKKEQEKNLNHEKKEVDILMVGLQGSGKSTILNARNFRRVVTTVIPNGLPVETVESDGVRLTALDVAENDKEPHFWDHADCVIFVVDSNDRDRISEARDELHRMLGEDNLRGKPLLVFANKKDIPNAMSTSEITAKLGLTPLIRRRWLRGSPNLSLLSVSGLPDADVVCRHRPGLSRDFTSGVQGQRNNWRSKVCLGLLGPGSDWKRRVIDPLAVLYPRKNNQNT
ncbi:ADP-ribosylation factor [Morella rubra]|uniref:ADP-ribosylation factor n=1 Tax=Morella rubra TaxID=262757 RepID=A0A6A1WNR0_9ROSI|nr:ADP-ribosylation factor [Morella rubra]